MAGRALIIPIYYLILIACIGVSSNFSFRGFYETFPNEIYVVVLILALGLFGAGLLLQIGRDRKSITQQLLALLIFFIFASFSTSSNMNYIYTKMLWEDVRKEAYPINGLRAGCVQPLPTSGTDCERSGSVQAA